MQCPGRVCAALAAGLRGQGRCWFSLLPLGHSLPSRPSRCVVRVVLPRCPFPSPVGTPFHAVSALRVLGLVALRIRAAWPLRVCALMPPRRTRPPPLRVGVARALRAVSVQGGGRAVPGGSCPSTFPAPVPCSAYLGLGGVARSLRPLAWPGVVCCPAGCLLLRAGFARCGGGTRAPWGAESLLLGCGASEVGCSRLPERLSFGRAGSATHWPWVRGGWACGPATNPTARALASWLRTLWRPHGGAGRGVGVSCLGLGRPSLGAHPRPITCPLGVRLGPASHWLPVPGM